jgi:hypothetical protein
MRIKFKGTVRGDFSSNYIFDQQDDARHCLQNLDGKGTVQGIISVQKLLSNLQSDYRLVEK